MDQPGKIPRKRSTKRKHENLEEPTNQELTVGDQVTIQQGGASPTTSQSHPASAAVSTRMAPRVRNNTSQIHSEGNLTSNTGRRQGGSHTMQPATNNIQYQGKVHAFPFKLHTMLEDATKQGFDSDVSWVHDGMAFKIHNRENFAKQILPRYFSQTQYKSFQRQLNLYNFQRTESGPNAGAYSHLYFIRGNPRLCHLIVRSRRSIPGDEAGDKEAGVDLSTVPSINRTRGRPGQEHHPSLPIPSLSSVDQGQADHPPRPLQQQREQLGPTSLEKSTRTTHSFFQESKLNDAQSTPIIFPHNNNNNNNTTSLISEIAFLGQPDVQCHEEESEQRVALVSSPGWPVFSMLPQRRGVDSSSFAGGSFDPSHLSSRSVTRRDTGHDPHETFDSNLSYRVGEEARERMISRLATTGDVRHATEEERRRPTRFSRSGNEDSTMHSNDIIDEIILTFGERQTDHNNR